MTLRDSSACVVHASHLVRWLIHVCNKLDSIISFSCQQGQQVCHGIVSSEHCDGTEDF